jgi:hypothetical protein
MGPILKLNNNEAEAPAGVDSKHISRHRIAILIPCYNEASSIAEVVEGFRAALPSATIYVYDNSPNQ